MAAATSICIRSNALAGIGSDQNVSRAIANGIALERMSREARGRPKDGMAAGLLLLFFTPANLIFVVSIIATHHNKRRNLKNSYRVFFFGEFTQPENFSTLPTTANTPYSPNTDRPPP